MIFSILHGLLLCGKAGYYGVWGVLRRLARHQEDAITHKQAKNMVQFLEQSGSLFIKLGQVLSLRRDITGEILGNALEKLQDAVSVQSKKEIMKPLDSFKAHHGKHIKFIEETPRAIASMAQVHYGETNDNEPIAIKLNRHGLKRAMERDFKLVQLIIRIMEGKAGKQTSQNLQEVLDTLEKNMRMEQDLRFEAAAMDECREQMQTFPMLHIPKVHWAMVDKNTLVTHWQEGVSLKDKKGLQAAGINAEVIGERLLEIFLNQALVYGFVHGDWHPGNISIRQDGSINMIDFGMMGRLSPRTRYAMAQAMEGFLSGDYAKAAEAHRQAGWIDRTVDVAEFAQACRCIMTPLLVMEKKDISLGRLLEQLLSITKMYGMKTQPELLVLQKTLVQVEGLARMLMPTENIWHKALPIVEKIRENKPNKEAMAKSVYKNIKEEIRSLPKYKAGLEKMFFLVQDLTEQIYWEHKDKKRKKYHSRLWMLGLAIIFSTLAIGYKIGIAGG